MKYHSNRESSLTDFEDRLNKTAKAVALLCVCLFSVLSTAQRTDSPDIDTEISRQIVGNWLINDELSDNSDDQVEAAIEEGGGKIPRRWFRKRPDDFYRGGPQEQELYDRISYDDVLSIEYTASEFIFTYADKYLRVFHSDGRRRRTTANDFYAEGGEDFSFANWDGDALVVEARPRDGGFTLETYTMEAEGNRLRVEMIIEPASFPAAIQLIRVYDRAN